jgi:hypothetical protein
MAAPTANSRKFCLSHDLDALRCNLTVTVTDSSGQEFCVTSWPDSFSSDVEETSMQAYTGPRSIST